MAYFDLYFNQLDLLTQLFFFAVALYILVYGHFLIFTQFVPFKLTVPGNAHLNSEGASISTADLLALTG